jgi:hypothetical protein
MKVPKREDGSPKQIANDPWMTLAQAVRWVAWIDRPEPVYGTVDLGDGVWISHGDLEEQDRLVYLAGAEKVRIALANGRLEAWGQNGYQEPHPLPKARWSAHFHAPITWIEFNHPFDRIIVERAMVVRLWPADANEGETTLDVVAVDRPKRRGRTKGTGFQHADALLLVEMQKRIDADPSLNSTSAAKLVADQAKGASFEAKVDRLARAHRAGINGE